MKISVERGALLSGLSRAARVIEGRNTIPILGNVLLSASGQTLTLRATDLDIEVRQQIDAEVAEYGDTTVPGRMLNDIVRKLPDGCEVALEMGANGRLIVKTGRSRFQLATIPARDYPDLTVGDLPHSFTVPAKDLKGVIDRATIAISTEASRYYLNGIFLHIAGSGNATSLRGVSTDGHRLAQVTLSEGTGAATMPGVILPRKTVAEVSRLLGEFGGEVSVSLSEQKIRFSFDRLTLTSKLIDGTFPDYVRVVPQSPPLQVIAEKADLTKAIDRVMTIASERGRAVKMAVTGRTLTLSTSNVDAGDAVEELEVDAEPDADITIGFNGRYLTDILAQVAGDTVSFGLTDAGSPALIQDVTPSGALFVLMPMRV